MGHSELKGYANTIIDINNLLSIYGQEDNRDRTSYVQARISLLAIKAEETAGVFIVELAGYYERVAQSILHLSKEFNAINAMDFIEKLRALYKKLQYASRDLHYVSSAVAGEVIYQIGKHLELKKQGALTLDVLAGLYGKSAEHLANYARRVFNI